jgi:hypothetical protein
MRSPSIVVHLEGGEEKWQDRDMTTKVCLRDFF